jgi:hypothetical protein
MPGVKPLANMSSEEQAQQIQAMAQAAIQPTQRQKGPTITFKLESADHDPRRSYCFTEASKYLNRYRGLVVQQSGCRTAGSHCMRCAK